jgi:peptidoglycan/LPS O-acetylase OafA/YrhL
MRSLQTSRVALTAVFVALAAALGYLLAPIPNVELVTFTVFAAGTVLGRSRGAIAGGLAIGIFSGLNPHGSGLSYPPLYVAQIGATAFAGFAGGASAALWRRHARGTPFLALAGGTFGLALTLVYQGAVVIGLAVASPELRVGFLAAVVSNAFFGGVHVLSYAVLFAILAPAVLPRLGRLTPGGRP